MQVKLLKGVDESSPVDAGMNTDEKLYISEQFITDSLKQNFEFAEAKERLASDKKKDANKNEITEEDHSIDHDYVENFIRVINNFEAYSSLSDAFKDWISASLDRDGKSVVGPNVAGEKAATDGIGGVNQNFDVYGTDGDSQSLIDNANANDKKNN